MISFKKMLLDKFPNSKLCKDRIQHVLDNYCYSNDNIPTEILNKK